MSVKFVLFAACCALFSGVTVAQTASLGRCPDVSVVTNFNATSYLGTWYEYASSFLIFELGGKCIKAEYSDAGNDVVGVRNEQIYVLTNLVSSIEGTATLTTTTGEAKLEVTFSTTPFPAPYWVLGTDYDNYSVVWGCTNVGLVSFRNAWILTRERVPSAEVLESAYSVLDANNIARDYVSLTTQEGCTN